MLRLVSLVLLVLWQPYAFAFSPAAPQSRLLTTPLASDAASDFGSAMPEEVSPYERLGITRDQLALGINPEDVLNYCGTREDIIERTMADISSLNRAKAEEEVDRFLLDAECLRIFIEFSKRKAEDPDFAVAGGEEEEEGFFSFRTVVIAYLGYVAYTTVPTLFRKWVATQEAQGSWHGSGIPFIDEWLQNSAQAAVDASAVSDQVSAVVDAVSSSGLS